MILVTGANGYVGNVLVKRLTKDGHTVRAFCKNQKHVKEFLDLGVEVAFGNVSSYDSVVQAMTGIESVIHLASIHGKLTLEQMEGTNVTGVKNILEASHKSGVQHIIHFSSIAVYGEAINIVEGHPRDPYDDYGISKLHGEKLIEDFSSKFSVPKVSIIRPPHIYGPGGWSNLANMFKMVKRKRYAVIGDGKALINAIYITDILDATILLLTKKECWGRDYIISDDQSYSIRKFSNILSKACQVKTPIRIPYTLAYFIGFSFEVIEKISGRRMPLSRGRVINITRSRSYKIDKASRELGFSPKIHFEEGSIIAAKWYQENGLL
jgi:nucleoside-diphosphate-sugar epimerase